MLCRKQPNPVNLTLGKSAPTTFSDVSWKAGLFICTSFLHRIKREVLWWSVFIGVCEYFLPKGKKKSLWPFLHRQTLDSSTKFSNKILGEKKGKREKGEWGREKQDYPLRASSCVLTKVKPFWHQPRNRTNIHQSTHSYSQSCAKCCREIWGQVFPLFVIHLMKTDLHGWHV